MDAPDLARSMDRIADVLQIPLTLEGKFLKGQRVATIAPLPLLKMFSAIMVRSYINSTHLGVVARIMGALHVLVLHYPPTNTTTLMLLDESKSKGGEMDLMASLHPDMDGPTALALLHHTVVKQFIWRDRKWHPFVV